MGKGGGTTVSEPDYEYNARMATIAEDNQEMARDMYNIFLYGVPYDPTESIGGDVRNPEYDSYLERKAAWEADPAHKGTQKLVDTGFGNLETVYENQVPFPEEAPPQTVYEEEMTMGEKMGYDDESIISEYELMQNMMAAQNELLPSETAFKLATYEEGEKLVREKSNLMQDMYKQALAGVDVDKRVSESRAGVEHAFANAQSVTNRELGRMGIDPSSGRGLAMSEGVGMEKAKAMAGSEAGVRREAEDENFKRIVTAAGMPIG